MHTPWNPAECARYWVVGGRYEDDGFRRLSSPQSFGPVATRYEAEALWRRLSFARSHEAQVRYTIVSDPDAIGAA